MQMLIIISAYPAPPLVLPVQYHLTAALPAPQETIYSTMCAMPLVQVVLTPTTPRAVFAILLVPPAIQVAVYLAI